MDQSFAIFSFAQGDFITGTSRAEHNFLELGHLSFGHGRPPPTLDALIFAKFLPSTVVITGKWSQVRILTWFRYQVSERKFLGPKK